MQIRILCALILMLGTFNSYAFAQRETPSQPPQRLYNVSRGALYAGTVFDLGSTEVFLRRGYQEANPLLRNRGARLAIATGTTITFDIFTKRIQRTNPKLASFLNFAVGGSKLGIGVTWNLKR